jgi:uncharacterized protein (TIGR02996 family)
MAKKKPLTTAEAFLRAINEEPDEDTHRLVYADWLDDNGQPERAEFIRVQGALPKMAPDDPRRPDLAAREQALYDAHKQAWLDELPDWARPRAYSLRTFRRGFVAQVLCTARQWLKGAGTLLRRVPPPDRLILYACRDALAASPLIEGLTDLDLSKGHVGPEGVEALAATTRPTRLETLDLTECPVGDRGVVALAASPVAAMLRRLRLSLTDVGPVGAAALVSSPRLAGLEELALTAGPLGDEAASALLRSPHLARLRVLWIRKDRLSAATLRELHGRFGY